MLQLYITSEHTWVTTSHFKFPKLPACSFLPVIIPSFVLSSSQSPDFLRLQLLCPTLRKDMRMTCRFCAWLLGSPGLYHTTLALHMVIFLSFHWSLAFPQCIHSIVGGHVDYCTVRNIPVHFIIICMFAGFMLVMPFKALFFLF